MKLDNDDKESLQKALVDAQENDYEWLLSVFGEDGVLKLTNDIKSNKVSKIYNIEKDDKENVNKNEMISQSLPDNETKYKYSKPQQIPERLGDFISLGYSANEVNSIQLSLRDIILEKSVRRPRRGIPDEWLIKTNPNTKDSTINQPKTPTKVSTVAQATPSSNGRQRISTPKPPPRAEKVQNRIDNRNYDEITDEELQPPKAVSPKFSWEGKPPTASELIQSAEFESIPMDERSNKLDERVVEPLSFWPGSDEFKDLLLEESRWRIKVAGRWSLPLVREETKWRYYLYKKWLQLLDEGTDGGGPSRYELRSDDFNGAASGGPFGKVYNAVGNSPDPDANDIDDDSTLQGSIEKSNNDDANDTVSNDDRKGRRRTRVSQKKPDLTAEDYEEDIQNNDMLAKEYDEWLRQKFLSGSWTNTFEEEQKIRAMMKLEEEQLRASLDPNNSAWFDNESTDYEPTAESSLGRSLGGQRKQRGSNGEGVSEEDTTRRRIDRSLSVEDKYRKPSPSSSGFSGKRGVMTKASELSDKKSEGVPGSRDYFDDSDEV